MFTDNIYVIVWKILRNGEVKESIFIDKEYYNRQLSYLRDHKEYYKILENYVLDMEEVALRGWFIYFNF